MAAGLGANCRGVLTNEEGNEAGMACAVLSGRMPRPAASKLIK